MRYSRLDAGADLPLVYLPSRRVYDGALVLLDYHQEGREIITASPVIIDAYTTASLSKDGPIATPTISVSAILL